MYSGDEGRSHVGVNGGPHLSAAMLAWGRMSAGQQSSRESAQFEA